MSATNNNIQAAKTDKAQDSTQGSGLGQNNTNILSANFESYEVRMARRDEKIAAQKAKQAGEPQHDVAPES